MIQLSEVAADPARRSLARLRLWEGLLAVVVLGLVATIAVRLIRTEHGLAPEAALVFVLSFVTALIANEVAHELAHLLGALVLRMRPSAVVVLGLRFGRAVRQAGTVPFSHVRVAVDPAAPALGARFALFHLAGPAANLGLAGYCLSALGRAGLSPVETAAWQTGLAVSAVLAVGNLLPVGSASFHAADGARILWWLTRPARMRRILATQRQWQRFALLRAAAVAGEVPDLAELRELAFSSDRGVASAAAMLFLVTARSLRAADQSWLAGLAESDAVTEPAAGVLAAAVAWTRLIALLTEAVRTKQEPDAAAVAAIAPLAELGLARNRAAMPCRIALALVRVLQQRPAEARNLLIDVAHERIPDAVRANLFAVRALAEVDLGDLAQARRLIQTAPESGLLPFARLVVERAATGP
ncbi:MAG TPA: hypothetical protein VGN81_02225 [Pseudonocardiaceae bacterium]